MKAKECRAFDFELRAENNEKHGNFVEGRAIVFGQPYDNGFFTEYIDKGALDKTDFKDVRLLVNHDVTMIPLARSRNNTDNSTMQLMASDEGLDIRADLDTARNATAQALYSAADRGDVTGMSFMFTVNGDKWEDIESEHPTRHITDIGKVFEVSAVTFPAYEQTSFNARSTSEALESAAETLESVKRMAKKQADYKEKEARLQKIKLLQEKIKAIREK